MKKLLICIFSLTLLTSCNLDKGSQNKEENATTPSDTIQFISQRHLHEQTFGQYNFNTEAQWDSLNKISQKKVLHHKGTVHPDTRTFGWHIYANGTAYKNYNFSMLWGVSYFSYTVEPKTGSYKSIHQWKTTAMIDSAKAHSSKVFLSVSNFGSANNAVFLKNPEAYKTLSDSLSALLVERSAQGINIDFEGVSKENKEDFTRFIIQVSKSLKQANPQYMVSLCLYAIDWHDIFDIKSIDPYIDFYTLMGYDYYGSFSKTTGPVTPFTTSTKFGEGLQASVTSYQNKGVQLNKLIVGLPYYGAEWYTKSAEPGAAVTKFKSHPPYKSIRKFYLDSLHIPIQFDPDSESSYIIIKDTANKYRQLFFEDTTSLAIKYDWIKKNNLGGVGIWALGYDDGYPELWNLLTEKFSEERHTTLHNNQ